MGGGVGYSVSTIFASQGKFCFFTTKKLAWSLRRFFLCLWVGGLSYLGTAQQEGTARFFGGGLYTCHIYVSFSFSISYCYLKTHVGVFLRMNFRYGAYQLGPEINHVSSNQFWHEPKLEPYFVVDNLNPPSIYRPIGSGLVWGSRRDGPTMRWGRHSVSLLNSRLANGDWEVILHLSTLGQYFSCSFWTPSAK